MPIRPASTSVRGSTRVLLLLALALPSVPLVRATLPDVPLRAEPPRNWHLLDDSLDHFPGISAERAYNELLKGKQPARTVIVAVIDGGVDTSLSVFKGVLWTNTKEVIGNKKDDDHNGYVDDIHGWGYLGSPDGKNYRDDLSEEQRVLAMCRRATAQGLPEPKIETARLPCAGMILEYNIRRDSVTAFANWVRIMEDSLLQMTKVLRKAMSVDSLTEPKVREFKAEAPEVLYAQKWWLNLKVYEKPETLIAHDNEAMTEQLKAFAVATDPRSLVGDHYEKYDERGYGNNDVTGPEPSHGTAVAGVIAALADSGTSGVARAGVRIMSLRTVPSGDERDKDVANAIRYAADNGASIINMSFGKHISPGKSVVDAAVAYAEKKGVLMVHAAGNDGELITEPVEPYPSPMFSKGGRASSWIEVGASSFEMGDHLAAIFSNFGKERVDIFAPGDEILSPAPGGGFNRESGTSLASPVVTGVAAVLMSYYPKLTALDVKRILLASAMHPAIGPVIRPGMTSDSVVRVPFGDLSRTGGIVNLYSALKMAAAEQGGKTP